MSRNYKHRTKVLGIPVHGLKDGIYPEVELRKWQLVENILLAATRSLRDCIFAEGGWKIKPDSDGTATVVLHADASSMSPSVVGVVKGLYFAAGQSVEWSGLEKGKRHFLYLAPTKETRLNPSSIRSYARTRKEGRRASLLMAIVDLTDGRERVDGHPDGKQYAETLSSPGHALHSKTVDFESAGKDGFLLTMTRKVAFVQISRMYAGDLNGRLGEIAIGYFGKDDSVEDSHHAMVYNKGDKGIPLRAVVFSQ